MRRARGLWGSGALAAALIVEAGAAWAEDSPESTFPILQISEQQTDGNFLRVAQARVPRPGWIAVHRVVRDGEKAKSEVVGFMSIKGEQFEMVVPLSSPLEPGQQLIVALHEDKGVPGTFEFDPNKNFVDDLYVLDGAPVAALISTSSEPEGDE